MTLVIDAEPELMARLQEVATEAGMPVAELARSLLRKQVLLETAPRQDKGSDANLLTHGVTEAPPSTKVPDPFRGMFADEPELMAEIVEEAMRAREERPFRSNDG